MSTEKPLYIAFVWHMHQPYYKDLITGHYSLPWVRLHSCKDYYDMVAILDDFPEIHQTFNLVPSLISQIEDYVHNNATDTFMDLTLKKAKDLTPDDKAFMLHNFFMANWDTMVKVSPRYNELLQKRGEASSLIELKELQNKFTDQELIDLCVLFNLAWIDPYFKDRDEELKKLVKKARKFSEADKELVIAKQKDIMSKVLGKYKEVQDRGQIELTTTPFYHPILPLLCDTNTARVATPHINLPQIRFRHPEDARVQVDKAVQYYEKYFGRKPLGMWPAEGSVSSDIVPIIADAGIKWIATDEAILAHCVDARGRDFRTDVLYKPYKVRVENTELDIIFRDRELSDVIGFHYANIDPREAAKDFLGKLTAIRERVKHTQGDNLVSIILDGENAWEFFPNDGKDFLYTLYEGLMKDPLLKTTTVSDYLRQHPPVDIIEKLHPGSWIDHNYRVWIGHSEDNLAWDYLSKTRRALVDYEAKRERDKAVLEKAWEELYIAEGSDWNWWYGDDHISGNDEEFDRLYRQHLMNVFIIIGLNVPDFLRFPITGSVKAHTNLIPRDLINPKIDGKSTSYFEWKQAGFYDVKKSGGTMHQSESIVTGIYYGFNLERFFLRVDTTKPLSDKKYFEKVSFDFKFFFKSTTMKLKLEVNQSSQKQKAVLHKIEKDQDTVEKEIESVMIAKTVEMSIGFDELGVGAKDMVNLTLVVKKDGVEIERWPHNGVISLQVPGEDYLLDYWSV
ncbi:MAG: glycoside hydrolase family 57 protein [bacterium]